MFHKVSIMALTVTCSINQHVYLDDEPLKIVAVKSATCFAVRFRGREFMITHDAWQEVMPAVNVSAGLPRDRNSVRLKIDAPQNVDIAREKVYVRSL